MNRQLVFVHGRAQQKKDALALKQEWIASWASGLAKSGLSLPLAEEDIRFPFYGDTLAELAAGVGIDEAARIVVRGLGAERAFEDDPEQQQFIRDYVAAIQDKLDLPEERVLKELDRQALARGEGPVASPTSVLNWGWVQSILSVLDKRVPGASGASVALFTNDVYQYLTRTQIRQTMNVGVRSAIDAGRETVVVAHSLGTVVAYDVLKNEPAASGLKVPLFVTLGSPLGVNVVKRMIRPIGHPGCAARWFNAMDDRDVVALFPLDSGHFSVEPAIENKTDVDNPTSNRHGISGYLGDREVARRIYDALLT